MQWFDPRKAGWYRKGSVPKREEGREQREGMRGSKDAMVRSQKGGMVQKRFGP